jgi:hypothetical protein
LTEEDQKELREDDGCIYGKKSFERGDEHKFNLKNHNQVNKTLVLRRHNTKFNRIRCSHLKGLGYFPFLPYEGFSALDLPKVARNLYKKAKKQRYRRLDLLPTDFHIPIPKPFEDHVDEKKLLKKQLNHLLMKPYIFSKTSATI